MHPQNQKLKKLTIKAFNSSARLGEPFKTFEAMYNPEEFSQRYQIAYGLKQGFDSSGRPANFARSKPKELNLKLVLDGSGVNEIGLTGLAGRKTVAERVKQFIDLTYAINGKIHEPNYLLVEWGGKEDGGLIFSCRLGSVKVTYTSFDRDGSPLRAELDIALIGDQEVRKRVRKENKSSPDLTHTRIIKSGDTLPLLTREIYGTSAYYLHVAQFNHLDNFRELDAGARIILSAFGKPGNRERVMSVVTPTILSSGKAMDSTFELVSIDVVKEVNRIPYALLTLLDGSPVHQKFAISDDAFFEPGKEIEIKLRYEGEPGNAVSIFKGLVVKQIVEANGDDTLLTIELKDTAIKLTQGRKSAVYTKKTDAEVISDLIGKSGLQKGTLANTQLVHPELIQYYCTDWDFILSRAEACGLIVMVENGEVTLEEISLRGQANATFNFGIDEIYNFELEVDASHQRASVESIAWDLKNQKLTQASKAKTFDLSQGNLAAASLANEVGGNLEALASTVPLAPKVLQAWADGVMVRSRMAMIRGHLTVRGFGKIHCLDLVEVTGIGQRFNGKTPVTGIRHRVDMNGWQTNLQFGLSPERFAARRDIIDIPAAGLLPAVNGLQIGIVDQFEDDPDQEFRAKVILPSVDEKKGTVWARLATPEAGKERGYFFRPEPGDEVVVGFFNDDPGQAVILGAMYGSKNVPPKDMAKLSWDNLQKGIVSKTGLTLGFKDDKKPSVFLQTPGENKIILDDDGEMIQITDQHGNSIQLGKDGIVIKSAKDLKIEASGNVEIKGSKVDVK